MSNSNIRDGFSVVEVLLAGSVFALLITAFVGAYLYGQESTVLAARRARAVFLAEEGLEAVRNIRDAEFSNLADGLYGLGISNGQWVFSGSQDTNDIFTRQIVISSVDTKRKSVVSNVSWQQNPQRNGLVSLTTRLTNWLGSAPVPASCNDYAVQQGYSSGICRQNEQQCNGYLETYLSGGDIYCTGGPSVDTCCAAP